MKKPLVSIIIPVYNRDKYISEAIDSVLNQSYKNFEIIIGDNCSTDNTFNIVKEYSLKDNRIKIFQNKENLGPVKNRIECAKKAKGEYSKILWSDDLIGKNFISKAINLFDNDTAFIFSNVIIFSNKNEIGNNGIFNYKNNIFNSNDFIYDSILNSKFPNSPGSAIFRTKDLQNNLLLKIPNNDLLDFNKYGAGNDLLIFLLTAIDYKYIKYIYNVENYFRTHEGSITCSQSTNKLQIYYDWSRLYLIENNNFNYKLLKNKFKTKIYLRNLFDKSYTNILFKSKGNINYIYLIFRIIKLFCLNYKTLLNIKIRK